MISRAQYLHSFTRDFEIVKHLATKVTPEMLEYRPTPKQRSLLELMQYLTRIGVVGLQVRAQADRSLYQSIGPDSAAVTLENFQDAMDTQIHEFTKIFNGLSDDALLEVTDPFGGVPSPRAAQLLSHFEQYAAYKMQLFLYLKSAGAEINSDNLWSGKDSAPRPV